MDIGSTLVTSVLSMVVCILKKLPFFNVLRLLREVVCNFLTLVVNFFKNSKRLTFMAPLMELVQIVLQCKLEEALPTPTMYPPLPTEVPPLPKVALPGTKEALPVTKESLPVTNQSLPVPEEALPVPAEALSVPAEALSGPAEALSGSVNVSSFPAENGLPEAPAGLKVGQ